MAGIIQARGRRGDWPARGGGVRARPYGALRNPFVPQAAFSDDAIAAMHATALGVLEDLGMRVLLPEARAILKAGGAIVDDASGMVRIGREMVEAALATAPRRIRLRAANPARARSGCYAVGSSG